MRSFIGGEQKLVCVRASKVAPFFEGSVVAQGNVLTCPEQTAFFDKRLYFFPYGVFFCRRLEVIMNFFDRERIIEEIEIGEYF